LKRDAEKREAMKREGITLIEIPYWWDGSIDSLKATIDQHAPGLIKVPPGAQPIPPTPPLKQKFPGNPVLNNSMKSGNWNERMDPTGWHVTSSSLAHTSYVRLL
jgi:hypothetical protein